MRIRVMSDDEKRKTFEAFKKSLVTNDCDLFFSCVQGLFAEAYIHSLNLDKVNKVEEIKKRCTCK